MHGLMSLRNSSSPNCELPLLTPTQLKRSVRIAEHLRRRLWKREKEEMQAETGKPETSVATKLTKEQIKSCPDCGGSGFCYPNGYDGGVVKCRHEKLSREKVSG